VADSITDKPDIISVNVKPKNWLHKKLIRFGVAPSQKQYELRRLLVGNAYRISKAVLSIPDEAIQQGLRMGLKEAHTLLVDHLDKLIYIVGVALTNTRQEPSKTLLEKIRWEFNDEELLTIAILVLKKSQTQSFSHTIILMRGLDIVSPSKVSPMDQGEIIAPGR